MSAVFRNVQLSWDGKAYEVKPTMQLLNKIENRVSLAALVRNLATENPQASHLAYVAGEFLRSAGAIVDDDEIYREMVTAGMLWPIANAIIPAIFPEPKKKESQ